MIILNKKNYMWLSLTFAFLLSMNWFVGAFIEHYFKLNPILAFLYYLFTASGALYFSAKHTNNFKKGIKIANILFIILIALYTVHSILLHYFGNEKIVKDITLYIMYASLFILFHPVFFIVSDMFEKK